MFNLKSITSFSLDIELKSRLYKEIPPNQRTMLVEFCIKEFLNKKSPERASILFQAMTKHQSRKKGVSCV